ncbi:MAG: manganese efflux pump [Clostridia bacterium]|nr:manganese efflux pump [Clostridia bacterium]
MSVWEILLLSVALSMDACAVAMTNGMTNPKMSVWKALLVGVFFGFFQFLMPVIGYFITGIVADAFVSTFKMISAWVSFALLAFLGGKMLFESIKELIKERKTRKEERAKDCVDGCSTGIKTVDKAQEDGVEKPLSVGRLTVQAIATSIDALAVGVTLQMAAISGGLALGVWGATGMIGLVTLALSFGAVFIGKLLGNKLADKASLLGGLVLVGIGLKILIESLI